jgi:RNA polymerase sigma-70 factor (ECF subfamily)
MSHEAPELRELLIRTRRGDEGSARRLFSRTHPAIVSCARVILRDEALARDAAQAVYLKILAMPMRTLRKIDAPMPWLVTLARNEARDALKKRHRDERREQERARTIGAAIPPEGSELRDAVAKLPEELAEVVVLKHVAGMTFDEIALALSANRNTVASRHTRALERLRESLKEPDGAKRLEPTDA